MVWQNWRWRRHDLRQPVLPVFKSPMVHLPQLENHLHTTEIIEYWGSGRLIAVELRQQWDHGARTMDFISVMDDDSKCFLGEKFRAQAGWYSFIEACNIILAGVAFWMFWHFQTGQYINQIAELLTLPFPPRVKQGNLHLSKNTS